MQQAWEVVPIIGSQFQALGQAAVRSAQSDTLLCENNLLIIAVLSSASPHAQPSAGFKEGRGT